MFVCVKFIFLLKMLLCMINILICMLVKLICNINMMVCKNIVIMYDLVYILKYFNVYMYL